MSAEELRRWLQEEAEGWEKCRKVGASPEAISQAEGAQAVIQKVLRLLTSPTPKGTDGSEK